MDEWMDVNVRPQKKNRHAHPRPSDTLALRAWEIGFDRRRLGGYWNGFLRRKGGEATSGERQKGYNGSVDVLGLIWWDF